MNCKQIPFKPNQEWTLFLDRDGVINKRKIGGYITDFKDFVILDEVIPALNICRKTFGRIIIVTNQQCVGKGLCTSEDIDLIHSSFMKIMKSAGAPVDAVFFCPHRAEENCSCRKPEIGLALTAKAHFPEIDFSKSIMVGDQPSDLLFGKNCQMFSVYVGENQPDKEIEIAKNSDLICKDLLDFANTIQ